MKETLLVNFVEALISDTLENNLEWFGVDELRIALGVNHEWYRPFALQEFEFRRVDRTRSYYCNTNAGGIYLIYELRTSGREGVEPWEGLALYLQVNPYDDIGMPLLEQSETLYQLEHAIRCRRSKTVTPDSEDADRYLELYLRSRNLKSV